MSFIEVKSLSKKYGNKFALNNCNFEVGRGEIVGLIGKNGAGKTTLFNCIAGIINPTYGEIFFGERKLNINSEMRKEFGILIKPAVYNYLNAFEFLNLINSLNKHRVGKDEINQLIEMVGLNEAKEKKIKSYSFGMRQRLSFAQAMLNGRSFILLDEPFMGLDIHAREYVKKHLERISKERDIPIIFSDHNLDEVQELCSRIIVLKDGEIVFDGDVSEIDDSYILTLDNIQGLGDNKYEVIDQQRVKISASNLHNSLKEIVIDKKIQSIEVHNKLKEFLN